MQEPTTEEKDERYPMTLQISGDKIIKMRRIVLAQETLDAHNEYRKFHGVPELTLDENLCSHCQNWAEELHRQNKILHSPMAGKYGENIFHAYEKNNVPPRRCVRSWYNEGSKFDWSNIDHQKGMGHFSQIIWKNSSKLGVGYACGTGGDTTHGTFLVCNYDPPGNIDGAYPENVFPAQLPTPSPPESINVAKNS